MKQSWKMYIPLISIFFSQLALSIAPKSYFLGNKNDASIKLEKNRGALLLMGGGIDVDQGFLRIVSQLGKGIDVVILRSSGEDGYNQYLLDLLSANSVETLIVDSRSKANDSFTKSRLARAELIFVAGGDQSEYLEFWSGTEIDFALHDLVSRGGTIGGTSAGLDILTGIAYDPGDEPSAISSEVVTDFCDKSLKFSPGISGFDFMRHTIGDSHFYERDRMGRLISFMAKQIEKFPIGIGISEGTSLTIYSDGNSVVDGSYEVYILESLHAKVFNSSCGQAFKIENIQRIRLLPTESYNFISGKHDGDTINVNLDGNREVYFTPSNPY